ncbi:MAG TPA: NAD(P)/FAD-dependent oxidoreductase [Steroidobacteraceae bacterium]|nr:NAD(P)/FAD-dependent oxidoreductase [Steroidobacteraceae bacterium]
MKKTQIVVVGGGAAGLELVTRLGRKYGRRGHRVTLVERYPTHIWKPLLHEVAAGSLDANLDEVGYRSHCHRWGYRFFLGSIEGIDRAARQIIVAPLLDVDGRELIGRHRIAYDYLVIAIGSVTNDFGIPGASQYCLFLDSRADADGFRDRLLNQCLRVSRARGENPAGDEYVRVAIVGGGATGVELAAELYNAASALHYYGLEDFDESRLKVSLLEAGPRILPALPEKLADAAREELEALGVSVQTNVRVTGVTPGAIRTQSGVEIGADLKVWAAGVRGPDILRDPHMGGLEATASGQLRVRPTLQVTGDETIFAIGDCCSCTLPGARGPVPPRAQVAHQMASATYRNLGRLMRGQGARNFVYRDHGSLVSLSRFSTVGSLMGNLIGGRMAIEGRIARFVYMSLYRMHLFAIHGLLRGIALILIGHVSRILRPRLKLH